MTTLGLLPFDGLLPDGWWIFYLGGIVFLPLALLGVIGLRLLGQRRHQILLRALPSSSIPPELLRQAQPWLGRLAFLGFPVVQTLRPEGDSDPTSVTWHLAHPAERTIALVTGTLPAGGGKPVFSLTLDSFLNDGRLIVTADRTITRRPPPHWSLHCQRFPTLEAQVQEHRSHAGRATGNAVAVLPAPASLVARLAAEEQWLHDALLASGDCSPAGERSIRPARRRLPLLACREAFALLSGSAFPSGRRRDVASTRKENTPGEEEIVPAGAALELSLDQLVERDQRRYRAHADQAPDRKYFVKRLAVLTATLVFFTAIFGRDNPPLTVIMLLGLIAVHDFGHWLAMKLTGYRGMGRFFIPWLGPTDRGRKLQAPAWQQLFVIFAGPLPGLAAGMLILIAGFFLPSLPLLLLDLGGLAVVYNAFHLLPFLPLDGGKLADLLIFRDLPLLRPLFTTVSALATLLAAFLMRSRTLVLLGLGMLGGLVWDIRMIKVVRGGRRLAWAGSIDDENEALRRIFRGVREEENEAFFRSSDWLLQIDVLLAEVMRRRTGLLTRFLGAAIYWVAFGFPLLLLTGLFVLTLLGGIGSISRFDEDSAEFKNDFPREKRPLSETTHAQITHLLNITRSVIGGHASEDRKALAARTAPTLGNTLDKLDWTAVGIAHHGDLIDTPPLSVWLEIQCGKMESANVAADAIRRAELLLHGIAALEPALTLADRRLLWDAEHRTLAVIERHSAGGKLDPATLQRIDARVAVLNKAPLPEVDNLLLVGAWGAAQAEKALAMRHGDSIPGSFEDARFWRHAYPQLRRLSENGFSLRPGTPATVALARHWKKHRRVGELPPTLDEPVSTAPGEAEFIIDFCEESRRILWHRSTTLSALRLEAYRQKSGRFPPTWAYDLPGGGKLTLVDRGGPSLQLTDTRDPAQRTPPTWLASQEAWLPQPDYLCPLHISASPLPGR